MRAKPDIKSYSLEQLKAMRARGESRTRPDAPIGPDPPKTFWKRARVMFSPAERKVPVNLRVDADVYAWFRAQGPRHLSRMNAVLRSYYEAQRRSS
jgi:uncharacterized protein (DUF4415 family)